MKHRLDTDPDTWKDMPDYWQTLACRCHAEWRGHARVTTEDHELIMLISSECPVCGPTMSLRRVSSDPETFTIRREDVR